MNGAEPLLDLASCRHRQDRLRRHMADRSLDAVVVVAPEHVQYLTGHRWDARFSPLAAVLASGDVLLVCPDRPVDQAAADEVRTYAAKWRSTLRNDQREASAAVFGRQDTGRASSALPARQAAASNCAASSIVAFFMT